MHVGDAVVLVGLRKAGHLNGKVAYMIEKTTDEQWMVRIEECGQASTNSEVVPCLH